MKIISIALKPLEPYFFGNDRNLKYIDGNKTKTKAATYYAVSEKTPSQTTLFGVLRYLGLSEKNSEYSISKKEMQNIGGESFRLLKDNKNGFGKIIHISNLFIMRNPSGIGEFPDYYVPMPLDHQVGCGESSYKPFPLEFYQRVSTSQGERMLPVAYEVKNGFADGYINLKDGSYVRDEDIFKRVETVGIQVDKKTKGYFKRVRYYLEKDYSLAFFAQVEDDFYLTNDQIVYMGYGKSAFQVTTRELERGDNLPSFKRLTSKVTFANCTKRVALSDTYIKGDLEELYRYCVYVNTQSREYREFYTNYGNRSQQGRFQRGTNYIRMIKAGSVFYVKNEEIKKFDSMIQDKNAEIAGFNQMTGDEKE